MSAVRFTLTPSIPYLASAGIGTCLASRWSIIFLGPSPHAIALHAAVGIGVDYFCKDKMEMTHRIALTVLSGILASKGLGKLSKKFDISFDNSVYVSGLLFLGCELTRICLYLSLANELVEAVKNDDIEKINELVADPYFKYIPEKQLMVSLENAKAKEQTLAYLIGKLKSYVHFNSIPCRYMHLLFMDSITKSQVEVIIQLKDCPQLKRIDPEGLGIALCRAIEIGNIDVIKALIDWEQFKRIPQEKLVDFLKKAREWVHFNSIPFKSMRYLLTGSTNKSQVEVIKELRDCPQLKHISPTGKQGFGHIFCWAVIIGNMDVIKELIDWEQFKHIPTGGQFGFGHALCNAAKKGHSDVIKELMECNQFRHIHIRAIHSGGQFKLGHALCKAAHYGHFPVIRELKGYFITLDKVDEHPSDRQYGLGRAISLAKKSRHTQIVLELKR